MSNFFSKKNVIVTGGNSGCGLAISNAFLKLNSNVIRIDKKFDNKIGSLDITFDLEKYKKIDLLISKIKKKYNKIDILKFEYFLTPGTIIVSDGRAANIKFLKDHFKRNWKYINDKKNDQHLFWLVDPVLGKYNKLQLEFYNKR